MGGAEAQSDCGTAGAVTTEEFLKAGRLRKKADGQPYQPTEAQLRFLRESAREGQRLMREDAEALNAFGRRLYRT